MGLRHFWSRGPAKSEGRSRASDSGRRAYEQVRDIQSAVGDALRTSFGALSRPRDARPKTLRHDGSSPGERARDAVYRDRGLHATSLQSARPAPAPSASEPDAPPQAASQPDRSAAGTAEPPSGEPICTRTMARLLAQQGHAERALRIYAYLLAQQPDDELQQEADALRESISFE